MGPAGRSEENVGSYMTFLSGISRPDSFSRIHSLLQTCVHDRCKVPYQMRTHFLWLIVLWYNYYLLRWTAPVGGEFSLESHQSYSCASSVLIASKGYKPRPDPTRACVRCFEGICVCGLVLAALKASN